MTFRLPRQPSVFQRSLKIKIPFLSALIFLIIFGLASVILIRQNISFQKQSLLSRAKTFSTLATKPIGDSYNIYFQAGFLKFREQLLDTLAIDDEITRIQIISVEGDLLFDTINIDDRAEASVAVKVDDARILKAVSASRVTEIRGESGDATEIIAPYFDDFGARPFSIRYFVSYESIYESINNSILTIGFLTFVFLLLTLLAMTMLVHRSVLGPLDKVVATAKAISRGDLQRNIELSTGDELTDLAASLNQMTVTLRKNIEDLKELDKLKDEFVYLASHNLRSPLTVIKGYVSILQNNKSLDSETKESVRRVATSSNQLGELIESLINLVALEKKQPLLKEPVDLVELIKQTAAKFGSKITQKRLDLIYKLPRTEIPNVEVDSARIDQVLASLIDNAIKFSRDQGKIVIGLTTTDGRVVISVEDNGVGIATKKTSKVFQKFQRATDMLTYNYKGVGLGLYLTKLIIEAHQGKIWFESRPGRGTTFYVELPIKGANLGD
jgi:signal transduction histidine kinase